MIIASVLLVASVARAQPALTTEAGPSTEPKSEPKVDRVQTGYIASGVMLAADQGLVGAVMIEGGHRLGDGPLWLHVEAERGAAGGVDEPTYRGNYAAGRAGVEARSCVLDGVLCGMAGLDLGVRHVDYMAEYDQANDTGAIVVPRIGLDVGSKHLRLRPGLDAIIEPAKSSAVTGLAMTAGVAYVW